MDLRDKQEWPEGRVYDYAMLQADFQHQIVTLEDYHSQKAAPLQSYPK
jgi:hypothetical protein